MRADKANANIGEKVRTEYNMLTLGTNLIINDVKRLMLKVLMPKDAPNRNDPRINKGIVMHKTMYSIGKLMICDKTKAMPVKPPGARLSKTKKKLTANVVSKDISTITTSVFE